MVPAEVTNKEKGQAQCPQRDVGKQEMTCRNSDLGEERHLRTERMEGAEEEAGVTSLLVARGPASEPHRTQFKTILAPRASGPAQR